MDLTLRILTHADLKEIMRIANASFTFPWSLEGFLCELEREPTENLGVFYEKRLAGYAFFRVVRPQAHLVNLAVDPLWRRQKLGKTLLDNVLLTLRSKGVEEVWLEVNETNIGAARLYEQTGFKFVGRRKNYYEGKKDALLMTLPLSSPESSEGFGDGS
jgi:ribosomal-protein-alanine N-acetyltransferase